MCFWLFYNKIKYDVLKLFDDGAHHQLPGCAGVKDDWRTSHVQSWNKGLKNIVMWFQVQFQREADVGIWCGRLSSVISQTIALWDFNKQLM